MTSFPVTLIEREKACRYGYVSTKRGERCARKSNWKNTAKVSGVFAVCLLICCALSLSLSLDLFFYSFLPQKPLSSQFDSNLDQMSAGMARLKGMAATMNSELRSQNQQLERLDPAIDRATTTMGQQNRQMNKLLGVKNKWYRLADSYAVQPPLQIRSVINLSTVLIS